MYSAYPRRTIRPELAAAPRDPWGPGYDGTSEDASDPGRLDIYTHAPVLGHAACASTIGRLCEVGVTPDGLLWMQVAYRFRKELVRQEGVVSPADLGVIDPLDAEAINAAFTNDDPSEPPLFDDKGRPLPRLADLIVTLHKGTARRRQLRMQWARQYRSPAISRQTEIYQLWKRRGALLTYLWENSDREPRLKYGLDHLTPTPDVLAARQRMGKPLIINTVEDSEASGSSDTQTATSAYATDYVPSLQLERIGSNETAPATRRSFQQEKRRPKPVRSAVSWVIGRILQPFLLTPQEQYIFQDGDTSWFVPAPAEKNYD